MLINALFLLTLLAAICVFACSYEEREDLEVVL